MNWPLIDALRRRLRRKADPLDLALKLIRPGRRLKTLVHAGAHLAQERNRYEAAGFEEILWIEGSPAVFERLQATLATHRETGSRATHAAVCALLADKDNEERELRTFSNDGMSNSLFPPTAESLRRWPGVRETAATEAARTTTLDALLARTGHAGRTDLLVVDVQGAELLVLRGADRTLREAGALICEVSTVPYYDGGVLYPELRAFLAGYGYEPQSAPRRHCDLLFMRPADLQ